MADRVSSQRLHQWQTPCGHSKTADDTLKQLGPGEQVQAEDIILWGLRVRMCLATGICEGKRVCSPNMCA